MSTVEAPWHAAYPAPRGAAATLPRQEFLQWFKEGKQPGKDFVLVDLRRTDYEGGTIRGSLNLPAQSLYPAIPTLYKLLAASKVKSVIWYCGSSRGRGTRAGGWFADYLQDQGETNLKSLVLEGGIKGWVAAGPEYTELMDEYDASFWAKPTSG
ncbi:Rhodanese-like domain-containing protein [Aspergillus pseudotamarii]|uniref:Rhodanese-like domain-containing protein n=1 Tax=Aspergillus pseudotamarii TaxID=132259 RepID=A0A5N6ST94_ASPPS|nr:Rhodanese-like domain-containing protein [Aspergillus pseudotamarii]KAE8136344.1 Rhodanese-like domain-containing protein [Aspergillus pseudotamarii]